MKLSDELREAADISHTDGFGGRIVKDGFLLTRAADHIDKLELELVRLTAQLLAKGEVVVHNRVLSAEEIAEAYRLEEAAQRSKQTYRDLYNNEEGPHEP